LTSATRKKKGIAPTLTAGGRVVNQTGLAAHLPRHGSRRDRTKNRRTRPSTAASFPELPPTFLLLRSGSFLCPCLPTGAIHDHHHFFCAHLASQLLQPPRHQRGTEVGSDVKHDRE